MRNTVRRKLAIASHSAPREGNIYGRIELDAGAVLDYLAELRDRSGEQVTITHVVGAAVGRALRATPSLNGYLRFGVFRPHDDVALAFLVATDAGEGLAMAKVADIDRLSARQVAAALRERAARLRAGEDADFESSQAAVRLIPVALLRRVVLFTGWLAGSLGVDIPALGVRRFPFGAAIVTSVGMFGVDEAFVPPTPFARVPLYVLVGQVSSRPAVVDGAVVARPMVTLTATIDHRFVDGFQAATLAEEVRRVFADPAGTLGA